MTEKIEESQIDEEMAGVADEYESIDIEDVGGSEIAESETSESETEASSSDSEEGGPFADLPDDSFAQVDDPYDPMVEPETSSTPEKDTADVIRADKEDAGKRGKSNAGHKGKFSLMSGKAMLAVGGTLTAAVLATIAFAPGSPSGNANASQENGLMFESPGSVPVQVSGQGGSAIGDLDPFAGASQPPQSSDQFGLLDPAGPANSQANPNFDPILAQEFCDPEKPQNIDIYLCTDMGVDTSALELAVRGFESGEFLSQQTHASNNDPSTPAPEEVAGINIDQPTLETVKTSTAPSMGNADQSEVVIQLTQDIEKLKAELAAAKADAKKNSGESVLSDSDMAEELKDLRHKNKLYIEENGRFKIRIAKLEADLKSQSSVDVPIRSATSSNTRESFDIKGWTLSGVTGNVALFKSAAGESFVVREGEMVDGFRIIEIDSTDLVVKTSGGTVRLR